MVSMSHGPTKYGFQTPSTNKVYNDIKEKGLEEIREVVNNMKSKI